MDAALPTGDLCGIKDLDQSNYLKNKNIQCVYAVRNTDGMLNVASERLKFTSNSLINISI